MHIREKTEKAKKRKELITMPAKHYPVDETESGYASASSSEASLPEVIFTKAHLRFLNRQLQFLEPQGMLLSSLLFLTRGI